MKQKLICFILAASALFLLSGCAEQVDVSTDIPQESVQQEEQIKEDGAQETEIKEGGEESQVPTQDQNPEEAVEPQPQEVSYTYEEIYQGDGYSFHYPKDTQIISDEETAKSFLLPGGEYVLNVTRINLSGQDISIEEALPVYRKTLEEKGNSIGEVGTIEGFEYENALIEVKLKGDAMETNSAQVFFLAGGYHYTFTISAKKADMQGLKKIAGEIVGTFTIV